MRNYSKIPRPQPSTKKCALCGKRFLIAQLPKGVRTHPTPYQCRRCGGHNPTERPVIKLVDDADVSGMPERWN